MPVDPPKTKTLGSDPGDLEFSQRELEELAADRELLEQHDPAELDRRIDVYQDQLAKRGQLPRAELPEDLLALKVAITEARLRRELDEDCHETYPFDEYEVFDCVTGGMGMVLEARDPELDRKVAIKMWVKADPEAETKLRAEALTLASLKHPNVVTVHRISRWNERLFFVMEWVEGQDGQKWIVNHKPPWRELRDKFVAAGRGLAAAHAAKIHHRDFKPSNVLIGDDGRVLVADFGIADKLHSPDPAATPSSSLTGTLHFIAPERLLGMRGDARSDQFSFCVSLWVGLHRQAPYPGHTEHALLDAIEAGQIMPVAASSDVPHWLSRVVRKGLAMNPEDRHRDMNALIDALTDDPPAGDPSQGGVGEGEDFETVGYMNAPADEGVAVRLSATTRIRRERWRWFGGMVLAAAVASAATALTLVFTLMPPQPPRSSLGFPRLPDGETTKQFVTDTARVLEAIQLLAETEEWRRKYRAVSATAKTAADLEADQPETAYNLLSAVEKNAAWLKKQPMTTVGTTKAQNLYTEVETMLERLYGKLNP